MSGRLRGARRRRSRPAALLVAAYAVVMLVSAFLHHDFACHDSSRTHCPSCQVTQHAQKIEASAAVFAFVLRPAGRLEIDDTRHFEMLAVPLLAGRSPPA